MDDRLLPRVILHIGQAKTGTTSIQWFFNRNRDALRQRGVLYPTSPVMQSNHNCLMPLVHDDEHIRQYMINRMGFSVAAARSQAREAFDLIRAEARGSDCHVIVLSSESLFHPLTDAEGERLAGMISVLSDGSVDTVAYLRSPPGRYLSGVKQLLKASSQISATDPIRYLASLRCYQRLFGAPVICRVFEREHLKDGDVVRDFLATTGVSTDDLAVDIDERNVNRLSAEAMSVLSLLGRPERGKCAREVKAQRDLYVLVRQLDETLPDPTKPRLHPEVVDHIARVNTDLIGLRDRYGIVFSDLDYTIAGSEPERPPLVPQRVEDICPLDIDRRDVLLDSCKTHRYGTS